MAFDIDLMSRDLKSMDCKELNSLKEAISKELDLRRKEELNKLIDNFKNAWRALEEYGIYIKRDDEYLDLGDIYYD